jgi:hypothetical protein
VRFVLKDGTEIHRIAPPALIYDLDTGKPCGRIDRHGKILPLSRPKVSLECRDAKAEVVQDKKDQEFEIFDLP